MKNIKVIFYACIFIIHGIHSNIFTHLSNLGLGCISSMKQSNHSLKKCIRLFPFFFSVNFLTEFISKKVVESKGFSKEKMPKKDISQTLYSYITNSSIYYLSNIAANITMNRSFKENHRIYAGISLFFLSVVTKSIFNCLATSVFL